MEFFFRFGRKASPSQFSSVSVVCSSPADCWDSSLSAAALHLQDCHLLDQECPASVVAFFLLFATKRTVRHSQYFVLLESLTHRWFTCFHTHGQVLSCHLGTCMSFLIYHPERGERGNTWWSNTVMEEMVNILLIV